MTWSEIKDGLHEQWLEFDVSGPLGRSGLESMGLLCRGHLLGSIMSLGKDHFFGLSDPIFLDIIKMPPSLQFHTWETTNFILPMGFWERQSENVTPSQFKGRRKSSHILYSVSVSQRWVQLFQWVMKILGSIILFWVLCFHNNCPSSLSWSEVARSQNKDALKNEKQ